MNKNDNYENEVEKNKWSITENDFRAASFER